MSNQLTREQIITQILDLAESLGAEVSREGETMTFPMCETWEVETVYSDKTFELVCIEFRDLEDPECLDRFFTLEDALADLTKGAE